MAGLKPIGSEKLQGMDKINRMLEISRYKENIPKPVNEDKSIEFKKTMADGGEYLIVKEKSGYVIKKSLNENVDYIEPMKNRRYFSSYSQALKRLNIIEKEVNINEGLEKPTSLFENAANEATKYILKFGETKEQAPAAAPAPAPAPAAPAPAPVAEPTPEAPVDDLPVDDVEMDVDMEDTEAAPEEEETVTYKTIQKLTGKLAQKIRAFNDDEDKEETMSSKDIKYVINSILSALDLNNLEEEDLEGIINKLEGVEEDGLDGGEEEMDVDMEVETPAEPEGEMPAEVEGEMAEEMDMEDAESYVDSLFDMNEEDETEGVDLMGKMEEMIEGMFTESKVDSVLKKYFKTTEGEKMINEEKKSKMINKLKTVSESKSQFVTSQKLISKYPNTKLVGKTVNKNLVFESNNKQIKITKDGQIL